MTGKVTSLAQSNMHSSCFPLLWFLSTAVSHLHSQNSEDESKLQVCSFLVHHLPVLCNGRSCSDLISSQHPTLTPAPSNEIIDQASFSTSGSLPYISKPFASNSHPFRTHRLTNVPCRVSCSAWGRVTIIGAILTSKKIAFWKSNFMIFGIGKEG